jgi:hypothetical protein
VFKDARVGGPAGVCLGLRTRPIRRQSIHVEVGRSNVIPICNRSSICTGTLPASGRSMAALSEYQSGKLDLTGAGGLALPYKVEEAAIRSHQYRPPAPFYEMPKHGMDGERATACQRPVSALDSAGSQR